MRTPEGRASPWVATLTLDAAISAADVPALAARIAGLVRDDRPALVVCDTSALSHPDTGTLDALARLALAARRVGCGLRLDQVPWQLSLLLTCTGLDEALTPPSPPPSPEPSPPPSPEPSPTPTPTAEPP